MTDFQARRYRSRSEERRPSAATRWAARGGHDNACFGLSRSPPRAPAPSPRGAGPPTPVIIYNYHENTCFEGSWSPTKRSAEEPGRSQPKWHENPAFSGSRSPDRGQDDRVNRSFCAESDASSTYRQPPVGASSAGRVGDFEGVRCSRPERMHPLVSPRACRRLLQPAPAPAPAPAPVRSRRHYYAEIEDEDEEAEEGLQPLAPPRPPPPPPLPPRRPRDAPPAPSRSPPRPCPPAAPPVAPSPRACVTYMMEDQRRTTAVITPFTKKKKKIAMISKETHIERSSPPLKRKEWTRLAVVGKEEAGRRGPHPRSAPHDDEDEEDAPPPPADAALAALGVVLSSAGTATVLIGMYLLATEGRRYYLDFGLLGGVVALALALLAWRARRWDDAPNRNFLSGLTVSCALGLLEAGLLGACAALRPAPGRPLADLLGGGVCGVAVLAASLAVAAAFASRCGARPPRDNRVHVPQPLPQPLHQPLHQHPAQPQPQPPLHPLHHARAAAGLFF